MEDIAYIKNSGFEAKMSLIYDLSSLAPVESR